MSLLALLLAACLRAYACSMECDGYSGALTAAEHFYAVVLRFSPFAFFVLPIVTLGIYGRWGWIEKAAGFFAAAFFSWALPLVLDSLNANLRSDCSRFFGSSSLAVFALFVAAIPGRLISEELRRLAKIDRGNRWKLFATGYLFIGLLFICAWIFFSNFNYDVCEPTLMERYFNRAL